MFTRMTLVVTGVVVALSLGACASAPSGAVSEENAVVHQVSAAEEAAAEGGEKGAADQLKAADEAEAKAQAALESRRAVERENRRRQDDYDAKVKAAQRRVRELNARFADWYYIVPTKEYAKIHLTRDGVIQKKTEEPKEPAPPK